MTVRSKYAYRTTKVRLKLGGNSDFFLKIDGVEKKDILLSGIEKPKAYFASKIALKPLNSEGIELKFV